MSELAFQERLGQLMATGAAAQEQAPTARPCHESLPKQGFNLFYLFRPYPPPPITCFPHPLAVPWEARIKRGHQPVFPCHIYGLIQSNETSPCWYETKLYLVSEQGTALREGVRETGEVMKGEGAFRDLRSQSKSNGIFLCFAVRGLQRTGRPPQWAAWVICSREEITFPSWTSSKIVRIWRVVTGPTTEKQGTVIYRARRRKCLKDFRVVTNDHLRNPF